MKFRSLYKFTELTNNKNFIFFYQILEEMLFDYTLDTYKPSILNLHSLIEEAFEVISEIEKGNIQPPNISHVLDELVTNLEKDKIANEMITVSRKEINAILKDPQIRKNYGVIKNTLAIIYNLVNQIDYKKKLELKIIELLKNEQEEFKEIRSATRSYITFLIYRGYNSNYIRKEVLNFFGNGDEKFNNIEDIVKLFEIFNLEYHNYEVFFIADKMLSMCISSNNKEESLLYKYDRNNIPEEIKQDRNFMKIASNENFYSINRKELDPFSARNKTENSIIELSNLINIFHHKQNIACQKKFIVMDENNSITIINEPIKSMHKCIDLKKAKAESKLQEFLKSFKLTEDSFNKFINSVRLHSIAIHSSSHENQLLNLWISLESLVPADTKNKDNANIQHIVDSIIPFLNMYYLKSLINKLIKDLVRWDVYKVRKLLKDIPGDDLQFKIVNLLSNNNLSEKLNNLMIEIKDFHLLNDRLKYFNELFLSKEKIANTIINHTERLQWQIRRIYRARNLIVHTGNTPSYTATLIEHIHSYLDIILETLIQLSSKNKINSVGQGFQYIELMYNDYLNFIGIIKNEKEKKLEFKASGNSNLNDSEIHKIFNYLN
jgi:hypothetical protein